MHVVVLAKLSILLQWVRRASDLDLQSMCEQMAGEVYLPERDNTVPGGLGVKAWPAVPGFAKNPEVRKLNCASPLSFQQCLWKKATDAIHLKQARQ